MPGPDITTNRIRINVMGDIDMQLDEEFALAVPLGIIWDQVQRAQVRMIIMESIMPDVSAMRGPGGPRISPRYIFTNLPRTDKSRIMIPVDLVRK